MNLSEFTTQELYNELLERRDDGIEVIAAATTARVSVEIDGQAIVLIARPDFFDSDEAQKSVA